MSKKITVIAVLVALTVIGSFIKIPAIIGSVALDAFPALVAAALLGGPSGAIVGGLGHLLSALIGGMPLGALHGIIAVEMALLVWIFYIFYNLGKRWLASVLFVLGNTFAAPLPFYFLLGEAFYLSLVPSLFVGAALNTGFALIVIPKLVNVLKPMLQRVR